MRVADPQHSSVPPEHSGIGIMSQIVSGLEDNPLPIKASLRIMVMTRSDEVTAHPFIPRTHLPLVRRKTFTKLPQILRQTSKIIILQRLGQTYGE